MAEKHLKKWSTSLVIREMQNKMTLTLIFHLIPIRMTKMKNSRDSTCRRWGQNGMTAKQKANNVILTPARWEGAQGIMVSRSTRRLNTRNSRTQKFKKKTALVKNNRINRSQKAKDSLPHFSP